MDGVMRPGARACDVDSVREWNSFTNVWQCDTSPSITFAPSVQSHAMRCVRIWLICVNHATASCFSIVRRMCLRSFLMADDAVRSRFICSYVAPYAVIISAYHVYVIPLIPHQNECPMREEYKRCTQKTCTRCTGQRSHQAMRRTRAHINVPFHAY